MLFPIETHRWTSASWVACRCPWLKAPIPLTVARLKDCDRQDKKQKLLLAHVLSSARRFKRLLAYATVHPSRTESSLRKIAFRGKSPEILPSVGQQLARVPPSPSSGWLTSWAPHKAKKICPDWRRNFWNRQPSLEKTTWHGDCSTIDPTLRLDAMASGFHPRVSPPVQSGK